jgi:hypothetical protein
MDIILLIKGNHIPNELDECINRMEFIAFTLKTLLDPIFTTTIKNISQNLSPYAHLPIIYINETGFYYEDPTLIKQFKNTISTFALSNKFYTNENIMFGIIPNESNPKYKHICCPFDPDLYISRTTNNFIIHFDNLNQITQTICNILKQMTITNNILISTINPNTINYYDLDLNLIDTINFTTYLEYIAELSSGNIYFITEPQTDIYKLYEMSMCNILTVANYLYVDLNMINELNIYTYKNINEIDWKILFDTIDTFNIRDKLILNYTWSNTLTTIINNFIPQHIQPTQTIQYKSLNISNPKKPHIITPQQKINDITTTNKVNTLLKTTPNQKSITIPKRKLLLQSQLLQKN